MSNQEVLDCVVKGTCELILRHQPIQGSYLASLKDVLPWVSLVATTAIAAWTATYNARNSAFLKKIELLAKASELHLSYSNALTIEVLANVKILMACDPDAKAEIRNTLDVITRYISLFASDVDTHNIETLADTVSKSTMDDDFHGARKEFFKAIRDILRNREGAFLKEARLDLQERLSNEI